MKFFYIIAFFMYCSYSSKGQYYSYEIKTFIIDKGKTNDTKTPGQYISYEPFLFEFNIAISSRDTLYGTSGQYFSSIRFDTVSVFVLNPLTRKFVEFSEFGEQAKILKSGKFSEKKWVLS